MDCNASFLTYAQTGYFSKTVLDYVQQSPSLQRFYNHPVSVAGIKAAIEQRKNSLLIENCWYRFYRNNTAL